MLLWGVRFMCDFGKYSSFWCWKKIMRWLEILSMCIALLLAFICVHFPATKIDAAILRFVFADSAVYSVHRITKSVAKTSKFD